MHPVIRAKVREIVRRIAVVNTEPTEAGEQILTPFHKYGNAKRIRGKPVEKILRIEIDPAEEDELGPSEQFLYMVAAEKEGLIKVSNLPMLIAHPRPSTHFYAPVSDELHRRSHHDMSVPSRRLTAQKLSVARVV